MPDMANVRSEFGKIFSIKLQIMRRLYSPKMTVTLEIMHSQFLKDSKYYWKAPLLYMKQVFMVLHLYNINYLSCCFEDLLFFSLLQLFYYKYLKTIQTVNYSLRKKTMQIGVVCLMCTTSKLFYFFLRPWFYKLCLKLFYCMPTITLTQVLCMI